LQPGVRIDDGIRQGSVVSPFYDPMVAKVIVHGRDRSDAIRRLRAALVNAPLLGLKNNGRFLSDLVDHPAFREARMTTTLIDQWLEQGEPLLQAPVPSMAAWQVAALALAQQQCSSWRANSVAAYSVRLLCGEVVRTVRISSDGQGLTTITMDGVTAQARVIAWQDAVLRLELDGVAQTAIAVFATGAWHVAHAGYSHVFSEVSAFPDADALKDASRARSPVAGKVTQVLVAPGDVVREGQQLVCVEAMKMEMWLCAEQAGQVQAVHAGTGEQVEAGAVLVELSPGSDVAPTETH
jgi:geranyl-CoA carboxylase alpha subunit